MSIIIETLTAFQHQKNCLSKNIRNFLKKKKLPGIFKEKSKKKKKKSLLIKILVFFVFGALAIAFFGLVTFELIFLEKIYPFVKVGGYDLFGKTDKEANVFLRQISNERKPKEISLLFEDHEWILDLDFIRLSYLSSPSAKKAFFVGRNKNVLVSLEEQKEAFWQKTNLDFDFEVNYQLLDEEIATLSAQIDEPAVPPTIDIEEKKVVVAKGIPGRQLNTSETKKLIFDNFGQLHFEKIVLPVKQTLPLIADKMVEETKTRAEKLLGKKLILSSGKDSWEIGEKELISFLTFNNGWDKEKIALYSFGLTKSIDRPAQDALFRFENDRVLEFKPAQDGQALNLEKTEEMIISGLEGLESDEKTVKAKISLPIAVSKPKVSTAEVNDLGIKELIGEASTWFYGSIPGRIYNVKLAASKLNGLLVKPGETFSLNAALGDISEATGYKQAYIIERGRTVLGDGGGVCQISTTLFRTVLNTGLPVLERRAHAYRVSYYEHNSGPGFDATVFDPSPDFKFKNDTPSYILIQTITNTANMKLTFRFYGTGDGREVYISEPRVWDQVAPPPALYQDDPSLSAGVVKQIDWKAWGAKAAFDWKVTRGDEVLEDRTFYSTYQPWQSIFLRGTGG